MAHINLVETKPIVTSLAIVLSAREAHMMKTILRDSLLRSRYSQEARNLMDDINKELSALNLEEFKL